MKKCSCKIRWAVKIVIIPCAVSINGEELVVSGYGHFGCCFYYFVWLILVNVPVLVKYYLAIFGLHSICYLSNPSNYFNATISNQSFPWENHFECYKKLASRLWPVLFTLIYFFSYTYILLYCWKIKHCDHCSDVCVYIYIYVYYVYIMSIFY